MATAVSVEPPSTASSRLGPGTGDASANRRHVKICPCRSSRPKTARTPSTSTPSSHRGFPRWSRNPGTRRRTQLDDQQQRAIVDAAAAPVRPQFLVIHSNGPTPTWGNPRADPLGRVRQPEAFGQLRSVWGCRGSRFVSTRLCSGGSQRGFPGSSLPTISPSELDHLGHGSLAAARPRGGHRTWRGPNREGDVGGTGYRSSRVSTEDCYCRELPPKQLGRRDVSRPGLHQGRPATDRLAGRRHAVVHLRR
ncbi:MAG: hypothetical protein CM1200mP2_23070 [Planctomycetaceae bacterium]|nr:MAG: hypothetical protein CM1200mP2_23070 [Planctomycetaceae bacterium]